MTRRPRTVPALILLGLLATLALAGCDPWRRQNVRDDPGYADLEAGGASDPSFDRPEELQGFFKVNRTAGALSSEAREIEQSLGAIR